MVPARDQFPPSASSISLAIVGICALTIAIGISHGLGFGSSWYDEQRALCLVALCLAACSVFLDRTPWRHGYAATLASVALIIALLSAVQSQRPHLGLLDWSVYVLIAASILGLKFRCELHHRLAAAILLILPSVSYVAGVLANYTAAVLATGRVDQQIFLVGFANQRFPGQLQALTLPLLPVAAALAKPGWLRSFVFIVGSLWWMCTIGSGSRTAWLALAAATAVMACMPQRAQLLKPQLGALACGVFFYLAMFHGLPLALGLGSSEVGEPLMRGESVLARFELWRLSLEAVAAQPLLGVGPMHFSYVYNGIGAHPHNFWLQLAAEWGLISAVLIASMACTLWYRTYRSARLRANDDLLMPCLLAALTAWFVGTQLDGYMVVPTSQLASTIVIALCVAGLPERQTRLTTGQSYGRAAFVAMMLIAFLTVATLPATTFGRPHERELAWRKERPAEALWPRFWQQGWIGPEHDGKGRFHE